jgi:uncharacterized protein (DUF924 family)
METASGILEFWFGKLDQYGFASPSQEKLWFSGQHADASIEQRFRDRVQQALDGGLEEWAAEPASLMALITLLDQFPRNIYRGKQQAYSGDRRALHLVNAGIASAIDRDMPAAWRMMFYLPLEHAEDLTAQNLCVAMYELLLAATPVARQSRVEDSLQWARRHRDIVARFGRFPHRNDVLKRKSTAAEIAWLHEGGDRFGQ